MNNCWLNNPVSIKSGEDSAAKRRPLNSNVMPNQIREAKGHERTCCANSKTRPLAAPARWQPRRQVANGANRNRVGARKTDTCNASNYQSPATFCVRSSSAVRPLYMGTCHDRAISQTENQLQAVGSNHRPSVHAVLQLASFPAPKGVGSYTSLLAPRHNPALNLAPSGRWTALKRRRLALR